jgi:hypothetical protein
MFACFRLGCIIEVVVGVFFALHYYFSVRVWQWQKEEKYNKTEKHVRYDLTNLSLVASFFGISAQKEPLYA